MKGGVDRSLVGQLASETLLWMADEPRQREDVADEVWAFALSTFVDGVPITPLGYDDSGAFSSPPIATDGGTTADGVSRYASAADGSPVVRCRNCGHEESMASRPHNPSVRDCPDCDDPQLEAVRSDTEDTVPTPAEDELSGTLEQVQGSGIAPCRLCDAEIDVSDAESWGDVLEALRDHGEEAHDWDEGTGWSA